MHDEAYSFADAAIKLVKSLSWKFEGFHVLDVGGRNINGTIKNLFSSGDIFTALDLFDDEGVDIVADFSQPDIVDILDINSKFDITFSTEVLEHAKYWRTIVSNMARATKDNGWIIITCATKDRHRHSAIDGHQLSDDEEEYYQNVDIDDFSQLIKDLALEPIIITTRQYPADLYALLRKS